MRVFVKWDPVYEEVICVHTTKEGTCEKCLAAQKLRETNSSTYQLAGDWFEVVEDKKNTGS